MEKQPSGEALFKLGLIYEHGLGVPAPDPKRALGFYSAAVRAGNEHAPDLLKALQDKVAG